jgi:transcriptional regulator with XRE-family HTH domain
LADLSFGEWLKRRRGAVGLTQEQLALQINCSTSALRKFESEERRPSAEIVEQIANIFNIPLSERTSFIRFARGDWQAFSSTRVETEESPWRGSPVQETYHSNLPASTTSFIGREKEIKDVIDALRSIALSRS